MPISTRALRLLPALLIAAVAISLVGANPVHADAQAEDTSVHFAGAGGVHDVLGFTVTGCLPFVPPVPPLVPGVWGCVRLNDVTLQVSWDADASVTTSWDDSQLHQGDEVNVTSSLDATGGEIRLNYVAYADIGVYVCDPFDFDGPDGISFIGCSTIDEASNLQIPASIAGACVPQFTAFNCSLPTGTLPIVPPELSGYLVGLEFEFARDFTISSAGVTATRTVTGAPGAGVAFPAGGDPSVLDDSFTLACSAPVGSLVQYQLDGLLHAPQVTTEFTTNYNLVVVGVDVTLASVSDSVTEAMNMAGTPGVDVTLGPVQADNKAPTISSIIQAGPSLEGSPESFTGVATDNCGVSGYEWSFSDGGSAFGSSVAHTFDDNGAYTARLTVLDSSGNAAVQDFDVSPIANVAPGLTPPPGASGVWGVPIQFHASAVDPGAADQPTLAFEWNFGDGTLATGATVQHAFAQPGNYNMSVTVRDKDGGSASAPVAVQIAKRDTTLVYNGDLKALPKKDVTLAATLHDEFGQPVSGRAVTFTLGAGSSAQSVTAYTDVSGQATAVIRNNQKVGTHDLAVAFAGDDRYEAATTLDLAFTVGKK